MDFLNRWRDKKIMFVGDSLSLNMWESLSCMIHGSVPNANTSFLRKESLSTVTFQVCFVFLFLYSLCHLHGLVHKSQVFSEYNTLPLLSSVFISYSLIVCFCLWLSYWCFHCYFPHFSPTSVFKFKTLIKYKLDTLLRER